MGWIKGETVEANPPAPLSGHARDETTASNNGQTSIFATPLALDSLSPFLFPSLQADLLAPPMQEAYLTLRTNLSFYLLSIANACSLFGRIGGGALADRVGKPPCTLGLSSHLFRLIGPTNVLIPGTLAAAAMTYAWPFATTKGSLVTVAVLYG